MKEKHFYEFRTETGTIEWFVNNYGDFIAKNNNLNDTNKLGNALYAYTGSMSRCYNNLLKLNDGKLEGIENIVDDYYDIDGDELEKSYADETKNAIKLIYDAFIYNVISDNIYLYHYFNNRYIHEAINKNQILQINNFISTTCLKNSIGINLFSEKRYNSLLKIKVKKEHHVSQLVIIQIVF